MSAKKPEPIFEEIMASDLATRGFLPYSYNIANLNTLDPSTVWIQINADPWFAMPVFRDMEEKDDVIASSLDTRRDGVLAKARRVLPASDKRIDQRIADFVEETLDGYFDAAGGMYTGLNQALFELLDAVGKGVSIGEIVWAASSDRVFIKDVKFYPQHLFAFGETGLASYSTASYLLPQTGPLRLRTGFGVEGVGSEGNLPEHKFIVGSYRPSYSNRWGSPLLRKVFWVSWFKRAALKQWLRYLEKGSGSVVSRYADAASPDERNKALDAARAINEESAVALPTKFNVEILEHVRQSLGTAFEGITDGQCNNAIMRVILGQTLTSRGSEGGGGSRALGDVHQQVRAEKIEADAKFMMTAVNQCLVWPLVLFNFGPVSRPPLWVIDYDPQKDLSSISTWLARLWTMRVKIPTDYVYTTFQIPEPAEGDETLPEPAGAKEPSLPDKGVDSSAEFAEDDEKKTPLTGRSSKRSSSRKERFARLRPSTIDYSSG